MGPHMNGTSLMNVSDGCPTLTCLSLKLRRCYFYVISTVSMTLVIININYDYCHIALYKMNCIVLLLLYMTTEWSSHIEQFVEVREELLIVGDFNIHVDSSNNESKGFLDILKCKWSNSTRDQSNTSEGTHARLSDYKGT